VKLFQRYALLLAGILLLAVGSVTGLASQLHRRALTREALLRAESIAVNLSLVSAEAILTGQVLQLLPLCTDATTRHEGVVYAAVVDKRGLVLANPDRGAIHRPLDFLPRRELEGYDLHSQVEEGRGMGKRVWDVRVPVRAKGSLVDLGWVHVGLDERTVQASVAASLERLVLLGLCCLGLGLGLAVPAIRYLVRPLKVLSDAARRVGGGDLAVAVPEAGSDELAELAHCFNGMVADLRLASKRRHEALRLESELQVARAIQMGLLPSEKPRMEGWEAAFFCEPAKELGGDYYDWFPLGGGRCGFIVADVSGKGVPAALHMANLRNLFRFVSSGESEPAEVLKQVNAIFFSDLKSESFVTLIYGVLDPVSGRFTFANAGHDPLLWRRGAAEALVRLEGASFPVGIIGAGEFDAQVSQSSVDLAPGDLLLLYTDGVTEAEDAQGVQFGLDGIGRCLAGPTAEEAVDSVREGLRAHLQGRPAEDDVTVMALWRRP
jgi:serine phosphatase RsbU (regulator of sigma subunit)